MKCIHGVYEGALHATEQSNSGETDFHFLIQIFKYMTIVIVLLMITLHGKQMTCFFSPPDISLAFLSEIPFFSSISNVFGFRKKPSNRSGANSLRSDDILQRYKKKHMETSNHSSQKLQGVSWFFTTIKNAFRDFYQENLKSKKG
jgi:hypothetical protein